jgi:hypothetical protein
MPPEKSPTPEINFLSGDELDTAPQGRFLKWALTWGKRIVVLTELVVILAFLSRFWLDTMVADLTEKIDQKKAVVLTSADFEAKFRDISVRAGKAKAIEGYPSTVVIYTKALALVPSALAIGQISVDKKAISFAGSGREPDLAQLLEKFKTSPEFTDIVIERIAKQESKETKSDNQAVDFGFKATYVSK